MTQLSLMRPGSIKWHWWLASTQPSLCPVTSGNNLGEQLHQPRNIILKPA
jgi:hypothetical protein